MLRETLFPGEKVKSLRQRLLSCHRRAVVIGSHGPHGIEARVGDYPPGTGFFHAQKSPAANGAIEAKMSGQRRVHSSASFVLPLSEIGRYRHDNGIHGRYERWWQNAMCHG